MIGVSAPALSVAAWANKEHETYALTPLKNVCYPRLVETHVLAVMKAGISLSVHDS